MSTREWGRGYDEGYQKGWNDAMNERPAEASNPVAYIEHHKAGDNLVWDNPGTNSSALYTTPPQRKPLTENEIKHLWYEACQTNLELTSQLIVHLARNIEAAHGIKGEA